MLVINDQDFPRAEILEGLGLANYPQLTASFGIHDSEEIARRQKLVRFFVSHPGIASKIAEMGLPSAIPNEARAYLDFTDPDRSHNPYWEKIHFLLGLFDGQP